MEPVMKRTLIIRGAVAAALILFGLAAVFNGLAEGAVEQDRIRLYTGVYWGLLGLTFILMLLLAIYQVSAFRKRGDIEIDS